MSYTWHSQGGYLELRTDEGKHLGTWQGCVLCMDREIEGYSIRRAGILERINLQTHNLEEAKAKAFLFV